MLWKTESPTFELRSLLILSLAYCNLAARPELEVSKWALTIAVVLVLVCALVRWANDSIAEGEDVRAVGGPDVDEDGWTQ